MHLFLNGLIQPASYVLVLLMLLPACQKDEKTRVHIRVGGIASDQRGEENLVYRWADVALDATARDTERFKPRPTITSRYLALVFISIYDAWTVYDHHAKPVYAGMLEKIKSDHPSGKDKEVAISYAAYEALKEYFYSDSTLFKNFMDELGLDPRVESNDPASAVYIGRAAAHAVINARRLDGANQYGEVEGSHDQPYFDYTLYECVNTPELCNDINRWQPKYFSDGKGGFFAPKCLTPFWHKVKPVALRSADQFRPGPPPLVGSVQLEKEVAEVVDMQANLTGEQKALVEFMRDGPASVQQAGHWLKFAQDVSRRDEHTVDDDVKMFMLVTVTAMDAFIACWDSKMYYDYARPFALVHHQYKDKTIRGWGGPDKGIVEMKGQEWKPYSPETFVCPPFPAYVSGHSTVSGGCAEVLKLYTGDDYFGEGVNLVPGILTEINDIGDTVTLKFPTFTETADLAGVSRVLGGYHIQADNIEGLNLGRKVGHEVWVWYERLVSGE